EILPEIKAQGANLVAISPELPDTSLTLIDKHNLEFEILTDTDNSIARELGIVFKLDKDLLALYKSFGVDLATAQGNENGELPLPATFVVDTNGIVILADFNIDYSKRLEPSDAVASLANL
ncbi:redoxin domain-containing protein, partial [Clostridium sp.]|uniref:redoxin domain-containing protein n=1 Tax=Clostridium sp. TaxID=1506 RepID=UPI001A4C14B9